MFTKSLNCCEQMPNSKAEISSPKINKDICLTVLITLNTKAEVKGFSVLNMEKHQKCILVVHINAFH